MKKKLFKKFIISILILIPIYAGISENIKGWFNKAYEYVKEFVTEKAVMPLNKTAVAIFLANENKLKSESLNCIQPTEFALIKNIAAEDTNKDRIATVRKADGIGQEEAIFLNNRLKFVQEKIKNIPELKLPDNYIPKIALCGSGGGYRSMTAFAGFISGFNQIGLLDTVTYAYALSGSTWSLAALSILAAHGKYKTLPLSQLTSEFKNYLKKVAAQGLRLITNTDEFTNFYRSLFFKLLYDQSISSVDVYGGLLSHNLFEIYAPKNYNLKLSQLSDKVKSGQIFMPIFTAITAHNYPYICWNLIHLKLGSKELNAYIPAWSFGRKFKNGISIGFAPEI